MHESNSAASAEAWNQGLIGRIRPCFLSLVRFGREVKVKVLDVQSCPTLCNPMDCSLPGSSVHGILQARILEWVATSFSRRSFRPRDQTLVSDRASRFFTICTTREVSRSYSVTSKASSPHPITERKCNSSEWESPNSPWGWQSWEAYHHSMSVTVLLINSCSLETSRTDHSSPTQDTAELWDLSTGPSRCLDAARDWILGRVRCWVSVFDSYDIVLSPTHT